MIDKLACAIGREPKPYSLLAYEAAHLIAEAVKAAEILFGRLMQYGDNIPSLSQDESRMAFYPRPDAKDLVIRWNKQTGEQLRALVKSCKPWNQGAFTSIRGINLRLADVTFIANGGDITKPPGVILTADRVKEVVVNCLGSLALQLDVISMDEGILPGRVLASFGIQAGERFETILF